MPNAFENMPDVGKKKLASSQPNRKPILLGVLGGGLLLLLCAALAGGGYLWYSTQGKSLSPAANTAPGTDQGQPSLQGASSKNVRVAASVDRGAFVEQKLVWLMNADGSEPKQLLTQASSPAFSPDGTQIAFYHWNDGIYVANSDGSNAHKVLGETNAKYLAWSHDGKWIAFSSQPGLKEGSPINIDAIRVDGSGRRLVIIGGSQPTWSPDDTQIAFTSCRGSDCGIFKASSLGGDNGSKVVSDLATSPAWSPDGKKIVYQADVDGVKQLFTINPDGSGKKQLTTGTAPHVGAQWSPEGGAIYYRAVEGGNWGVWKMNVDGSNQTKIANDYPPVDWAYERLALGK